MEFTGERFVPSVNGQIKYEHLHRYGLCIDFVKGKSVLDIASGEGYGSVLLARVAESVIGVDIDAETVEYASQQYREYQNLKFLVGSCDLVPLPDQSVDVVTSFETIEHHDKHEEMMLEIKRVLKPGGILIISSPNKLTYSDEPKQSNPFHVKELYYDQLISLLSNYFNHYKVYGQRIGTGSFIYELEAPLETSYKAFTGSASSVEQKVCSLNSPVYFMAVCSDNANNVDTVLGSVYIDRDDDLFKLFDIDSAHTRQVLAGVQTQLQTVHSELEHSSLQLQQTQAQLQNTQAELQSTQAQLQNTQAQLQNTQAELHSTQAQLQHTQVQLESTQAELQSTQAQLQHTQGQLESTQAQLQHAQTQLEESRLLVQAMESSKFWKLRKVWMKFKQILKSS